MEFDLFFLFFARMADMCLGTMRNLLAVRGRRFGASLAAFGEVMIYLFALKLILSAEMGMVRMGVFACGYALGVLLGTFVEERMALGTRMLQVVVDAPSHELIAKLRKRLPVTVWSADGRHGPKQVLLLHVRRREYKRVLAKIRRVAPNAFVLDLEPRSWIGGLVTTK